MNDQIPTTNPRSMIQTKLTFTTNKGEDEDKDDGKVYLHIGEKVDMEGAEKRYWLGERILGIKKKRRELDEDKDDSKVYLLHIGEKVDMEGAEKWYWLGERILGIKKKRRELLEKRRLQKEEIILK